MRRRTLLRTVGGLSLAGVAGCSSDGGSDDTGSADDESDGTSPAGENEVLVGPDGSLSYSPETLTVTPGTTVTWRFESASHNVSCNPDHHEAASLPDDAEPFASYDGDDSFATDPAGETFEHAFEVTGEYRYVCVPHAASGMEGTVRVEE